MTIEDIAKICHEVNKAYCESQGDLTQKPWKKAEDWQKLSAINGVKFHLKNPEAGPESSHNEWLKEKLETGWKYGITKIPSDKVHPCIVSFKELPVSQQAKDFIFKSIVNQLQEYLD